MMHHNSLHFYVNMDTSDEDDFSLILLAEEKLKDLRKLRSVFHISHGEFSHVVKTLN